MTPSSCKNPESVCRCVGGLLLRSWAGGADRGPHVFPSLPPSLPPSVQVPPDYYERVKRTHQEGGYGSIGYGCAFQREEAFKNLLRTHTTAVSARMLYQYGFRAIFPVAVSAFRANFPLPVLSSLPSVTSVAAHPCLRPSLLGSRLNRAASVPGSTSASTESFETRAWMPPISASFIRSPSSPGSP